MKQKLTKTIVDKLEPRNKVYDIYDTEIAGFFLRVRPTGRKTYHLFYRNREGKSLTYKVGTDITSAQAREIARLAKAEITQGIDINERDRSIKDEARVARLTTFQMYLENIHKPHHLDKRRSGENAYQKLLHSFSFLNGRELSKITKWDIQKWRRDLKDRGKSDYTIQRSLAELQVMLNKAVENEFIPVNPIGGLKLPKMESNRIDRYLSDEERKRLFDALNLREQKAREKRRSGNEWRLARGHKPFPEISESCFSDYLKPMVITALNTGLRRGELFKLLWSDINFSRRQLSVTSNNTKNKKARYIPLNDEVYKTLSIWSKQTEGRIYVFGGKGDKPLVTVKKAWAALLNAADIKNFRFHDMRHDFASQLVMKGVDLYVVKELMGHSTIQVTERYAHLNPKQLEEAVGLLNE